MFDPLEIAKHYEPHLVSVWPVAVVNVYLSGGVRYDCDVSIALYNKNQYVSPGFHQKGYSWL